MPLSGWRICAFHPQGATVRDVVDAARRERAYFSRSGTNEYENTLRYNNNSYNNNNVYIVERREYCLRRYDLLLVFWILLLRERASGTERLL